MKYTLVFLCLSLWACQSTNQDPASDCSHYETYFDTEGKDDVFTGGVRMIDINTDKGDFKVWTKRIGNNPKMKVLLLHGGPGFTHEIYECFEGYFPKEGIEFYYYDQLGSYYSDQPDDKSLWDLPRFIEEVEQVRKTLGLDKDNFYLFGQSWGGILAMEYALKYQDNLKGLVISNMMSSIPEYQIYSDSVLAPQLDPEVLEEIMVYENKEDYHNPRYLELIVNNYYTKHVLRMPVEQWPNAINRAFAHMNPNVYVTMQGPSEFGVKGDATLKHWDIKDRLKEITVSTLVIGAEYDTMDPKHMEWIANEVQNGNYLHCPNGSHLCQFDDQENFFKGLIEFIKTVDSGSFGS
jgi:proline iminopeptidase